MTFAVEYFLRKSGQNFRLQEVEENFLQFGRKPYLDEYLAEQGRLVFIDTIEKVGLIRLARNKRPATFVPQNPDLAENVVDQLIELATPLNSFH